MFKIIQLNRQLAHLDIDNNGIDQGDEMLFQGDIKDEAGVKGILFGENKIITTPDSLNKLENQARISKIIFSFGNDQLVVLGSVNYPSDSIEIKLSSPQVKAVIGGTGKFLGARGEVKTTRLE